MGNKVKHIYIYAHIFMHVTYEYEMFVDPIFGDLKATVAPAVALQCGLVTLIIATQKI